MIGKREKKKLGKEHTPAQREPEPMKIKTDRWQKIAKVVLWATIALLLLKGIGSILAPSSEKRLEETVRIYQEEAGAREQIKMEAAAFAEGFAFEYYTFTGEVNSDYSQRLERYLAKNLELKSPSAGKTAAEVLSAKVVNITFFDGDEHLDVDLHLNVNYIALGMTERKDIYIRVPVAVDSGRYAVESLPVYIPAEEKADAKNVGSYTGADIESIETAKIKDTLNSFFTVYYMGTKNEVSYYLSADSNVKDCIGGTVVFEKIEYLTALKDEKGAYLVETILSVVDNGQPIEQRLFLTLKKTKDKYYVDAIHTRPVTDRPAVDE